MSDDLIALKEKLRKAQSAIYAATDKVAADSISELFGECERALSRLEWVPVTSERFPEINETILIYNGKASYSISRKIELIKWWDSDKGDANISHWMPLPTPPTGED